MRIDSARGKTLFVVAGAVLLSLVLTLSVSVPTPFWAQRHGHILENILRTKMFISTFSLLVLLALLWNYLSIYREMPNRFTRSLLIFTVSLLLYAFFSNPLLHMGFGFRGMGMGPFAFLPDLFASIAVVVLLHQSFT